MPPMQLWLIKAASKSIAKEELSWDCSFGFVVRAKSVSAARQIASIAAGIEGSAFWLDATKSACTTLTAKGRPELILRDFLSG